MSPLAHLHPEQPQSGAQWPGATTAHDTGQQSPRGTCHCSCKDSDVFAPVQAFPPNPSQVIGCTWVPQRHFKRKRSKKNFFERPWNHPDSSGSLKAHINPSARAVGPTFNQDPSLCLPSSTALSALPPSTPGLPQHLLPLLPAPTRTPQSILHPAPEDHFRTEVRC